MRPRSPLTTGIFIALAVIAILLALWLIYRLQAVIVLILIATIIATGVDPLIDRMQGWRLPPRAWQLSRALSILLVLLGTLVIFSAITLYIGSVAWLQGSQLWENLPSYTTAVQDWLEDLRQRYPQIPPLADVIPLAREQLGRFAGYAAETTTAIFGVLGGLVSLLTVLVLTFYIILAEKPLKQTFLSIIPPQHQTSISDTLGEAGSKMGGWLRGQLILAGITAVVISAGMWLLGMPYPLLLGLIGGIGNLIPLLGSFLAGLVAVPIALLTKPVWVLIAVIVFFVVLGQVEGNWLAPRIMASQVELSPLSSILALLVGIALLGVVGALLAVPLAAGLRIILIRLVVPAIQRANRDHAG
jgi:predicted PurR-regulated permease PerM